MLCYNVSVTMLHNDVTAWEVEMEEKLISKKNLLEKYNISYGALYRWKRKGLIPDEWFIKKSTVTGQETFFPERLVCKRIETIQSMKDEVLLDELAKKLNGEDKRAESLRFVTVFGERSVRMCDISEVYFVDKNGEERDITQEIKRIGQERRGLFLGTKK